MNLTQLTGGGSGSYVGEVVVGSSYVLGVNPIVGTPPREYLMTGVLKRITGNTEFSEVITKQPLLCFKDGSFPSQLSGSTHNWDYGSGWSFDLNQWWSDGAWGNVRPQYQRIFKLPNGNYVSCGYIYNPDRWGYGDYGTSLTFAKFGNFNSTSGSQSRYVYQNGQENWLINDYCLFANAVIMTMRSADTGARIQFYRSTGGSFTNIFNPNITGQWNEFDGWGGPRFQEGNRQTYMAASPNLILAIPYYAFRTYNWGGFGDNARPGMWSSNNGTSWTELNWNPPVTPMMRFTWSPCANTQLLGQGFIYQGTNQTWYTSSNGNTWIQRNTAAFNQQASAVEFTYQSVAHSNTATLFSHGSPNGLDNYIYRTTDGATYTPINLATFPALRGIFANNGVAGVQSVHSITYTPQGNAFIMMANSGAMAVSTDDGLTWNLRPAFRHLRHIYPRSRSTANGDFIFVNPADDFGRGRGSGPVRIAPPTVLSREDFLQFRPNNIVSLNWSGASEIFTNGSNTGNVFVWANTIWTDGRPQLTPVEVSANVLISGNLAASNTADYVGMIEKVAYTGNSSFNTAGPVDAFNVRPLETYVRIR